MIRHYPEAPMPEPYKTYVNKRAAGIARVFESIVSRDVQLCPRPILPNERIVGPSGLVYGVIVNLLDHGNKSVLYDGSLGKVSEGTVIRRPKDVVSYVTNQTNQGNLVRLKDPNMSDSQGQVVVDSVEAAINHMYESGLDELVAMPDFSKVNDRYTIGAIDLAFYGNYLYMGREKVTNNGRQEVYGGCSIGVFHKDSSIGATLVMDRLEIPPNIAILGLRAIERYQELVVSVGRVSFDILTGVTENETELSELVDITPRVGGTTPAEVLGIKALRTYGTIASFAESELEYNPKGKPATGEIFVDTDTLLVSAQVNDVVEGRL